MSDRWQCWVAEIRLLANQKLCVGRCRAIAKELSDSLCRLLRWAVRRGWLCAGVGDDAPCLETRLFFNDSRKRVRKQGFDLQTAALSVKWS
jgi:hypothetical protein